MAERPAWPISRAAAECGVSRDTIKRRRAAGAFPNAFQGDRGQWMIPVTDLLADGLHPGTPSPPEGTAQGQPENAPGARPGREVELENELRVLQVRFEAEKQLREAAEKNTEDLRKSLRMLESTVTAPQPARVAPTPAPEPAPGAGAPRRRRWFSR